MTLAHRWATRAGLEVALDQSEPQAFSELCNLPRGGRRRPCPWLT
jgi:hypothetical protein